MDKQLINIYKNICGCVSDMEEGFVEQDENKFYYSLGEADRQLDRLRLIIERLTGESLI